MTRVIPIHTHESATPSVAAPVVAAPMRLSEEIERAKARIGREADRKVREERSALLRDFLDVLDDIDRAVEAAPTTGAISHGVELVRKRFSSRLADHGVQYRPVVGECFDPARHEAVSAVAVDDPGRDGVVIAEVRKGYDIGDQVLRPARVAVGTYRGR